MYVVRERPGCNTTEADRRPASKRAAPGQWQRRRNGVFFYLVVLKFEKRERERGKDSSVLWMDVQSSESDSLNPRYGSNVFRPIRTLKLLGSPGSPIDPG